MGNRYKIILTNNNIYKEIELTDDIKEFTIGTSVDCDFRLRKEHFFDSIELKILHSNENWTVVCGENLYISLGEVRKILTADLIHGDIVEIKYQASDNQAMLLEFLINFDNGNIKYERDINISSCKKLTIGTNSESDICIFGEYVGGDEIVLKKNAEGYELQTKRSSYGVYHNGRKAKKTEQLKNGDFFSVSDYFFYLKDNHLWTQKKEMQVNGLQYVDETDFENYPKFYRNTRIKTVIPNEEIEILDPPNKPEKPKNNLLIRLLPSMGILIAAVLMAILGRGGSMMVFSMITGGIAVLTAILGVVGGKKDYKKSIAERVEKYNQYIQNKEKEIISLRDNELRARESVYISQKEEVNNIDKFSSNLFDRTPNDDDFLCVRLGEGDVEAEQRITYKKKERLEVGDNLQQIPEMLSSKYKYIGEAPVVCDFKNINALGIIGEEKYRFEFLKNIVIDIAARQYYSDVKTVFISSPENKDRINWLRFLPHAYSDQIDNRLIAFEEESKTLLFEYLYKEMATRQENKEYSEHLVIFMYDDIGLHSHPVSRFINCASELGVTFIFFGDNKSKLPLGCSNMIEAASEDTAMIYDAGDYDNRTAFIYPHIDNQHAEQIVSLLAPVYTDEISLENSLTKNYSLFEMLNILTVDDLDYESRWTESQAEKSMSAPIGISKMGIVNLDLHDKADGPHGLVAGTTGSGKSEILQTYILAMSTLYHPYEVGFVIIDFKGGGMVNQFKELPHLVGAITNIDGKEINRSLKSIRAELQKRERLFAEADVNHIDKYIRKYKSGEAVTPLPHLIIIVDEFAELKAEQPEFMKELISAARIGRSLGVHLILATQKPAGQVSEQIWSNSRFKLCLKVQSTEDSNEMLKSPLAAEIKEPGRAYLQVGNNEVFELFQSAYSGCPEQADESNMKEFTIYQMLESGKRLPVYQQKSKKKDEGGTTQLSAVVKSVSEYCKFKKINKLPDICLPALPKRIDYPEKIDEPKGNAIVANIGYYDNPEKQYQGEYSINLSENNVMIIGSSQMGKTNLLQNIIRSLSSKYTPEEVAIYAIDFASMFLKNFEKLNHVGGIVTPSEDEKLKNLFKLLFDEIEKRKNKMLSVGVSSFVAYKDAGQRDIPHIVLIIDNLTALKDIYPNEDDIINLCRECLTVGISVVCANSQVSGISYKHLSNFSTRIALYCNDSNDYIALFDHCRETLDEIQGRCIVEVNKELRECQTYLAFGVEKEIDRISSVRDYVKKCNLKNPGCFVTSIPEIPEIITYKYISEYYDDNLFKTGKLLVGMNYDNIEPVLVDLQFESMIAVLGRDGMGKSNFLKHVIKTYGSQSAESIDIYIIDGFEHKLEEFKGLDYVKSYEFLPDNTIRTVKKIEKELEKRYNEVVKTGREIKENNQFILLIINNMDALDSISQDKEAFEAFSNMIGKYKNMNIGVVIGGCENNTLSYSSSAIMKKIRDNRHLMFFDDIANMKLLDLPIPLTKEFKKKISVGDAFYIKENEITKIKSVKYE